MAKTIEKLVNHQEGEEMTSAQLIAWLKEHDPEGTLVVRPEGEEIWLCDARNEDNWPAVKTAVALISWEED